MDPGRRAFASMKQRLNSKRDMVEGTGHVQAGECRRPKGQAPGCLPDWAAKTLGGIRSRLPAFLS